MGVNDTLTVDETTEFTTHNTNVNYLGNVYEHQYLADDGATIYVDVI